QKTMARMRTFSGLLGGGDDPFSTRSLALAYTATHREWMAADAVRQRLRHDVAAAFDKVHVILAPIAPVPAFPHETRPFQKPRLAGSDGTSPPYNKMLSWISLATALPLPATTVPAGRTKGGLPVGAQLIGPHAGDSRCLAVAQAIDENVRGF